MARPLRFTFIVVLAALGTGLSAVGGWRFARASAPVSGPIVLISIDTLRADHVPTYGYRKVKTPAIDALAADGTVFERAYAHATQTLPSHASILSGRLPFETGVRDNVGFTVKTGDRLLPQMLRDRGYATAGVVSSFVLRKETGIDQGFEFFDGDLPSAPPAASVGTLQRDGGESEAIAERWLGQQRSQRVFLFLHLYEPHHPYAPPLRYAEYAPYDGEIAYADELVGRFVRYLKAHQLYDQSTIVLLSDHGEGLGDHGEQEHGMLLYDEAIHVPLVIKQGGGSGAGRRISDVVQLVDVAPTILDLAKAPIPGNLHGRSLKALLDGDRQPRGEPVYSEALYGRYHFGMGPLTAITDGRYRYIRGASDELYDLEGDPKEKFEVGPEQAESRAALRATLDRLIAGTPIQPPGDVADDDSVRLEALGYGGLHIESAETTDSGPIDPREKLEVVEASRRAGELAGRGALGPAVDVLQRLTRENPAMADLWPQLARTLVFSGRLDSALRAYDRVRALAPRDAGMLVAAARALYKAGRFGDARRDAEEALSLAPDLSLRWQVAAHEALVEIAIAQKDLDAARDHAAAGQRADGSIPLVAYAEGLIEHHAGRYEEALPHLTIAASAKPSRSAALHDVHFYTADALGHLRRWDEAIAELTAELAAFPHNLKARASLAAAYLAVEKTPEAEQTLADLMAVARTPEGYGFAARVWTNAGEPRRAQALKAEARRIFHDDPSLKLLAQSR